MAQDPYTHAQTGLSIPEHDRVHNADPATSDRRVGQVFCLFHSKTKSLLGIYDNEGAAIRASERESNYEVTEVLPMPLKTNKAKTS